MSKIKYAANLTGYSEKEQQYFISCLKEMECIEFVENLLEIYGHIKYHDGYFDGRHYYD